MTAENNNAWKTQYTIYFRIYKESHKESMNSMNSDHTPATISPGQFSSQYISKSLRRHPGISPRDNIHHVQQSDSGLQRAP